MNDLREAVVAALRKRTRFDLIVIGGGANGAGIALEAASRGLSVALFERGAFGCGTSSRSSKLIHGGVRYLAQGRVGLVRQALRERAVLLHTAPAIVRPLPFVLPAYGRLGCIAYYLGLKVYDWLGRGAAASAPSACLGRAALGRLAPGLNTDALVGAVCYEDAMFDDSRLLLAILARARALGATILNHAEVVGLSRNPGGRVTGVSVNDSIGGAHFEIGARQIINATGAWSDGVRALESATATARVMPSQGAHIVVARRFHDSDHALVFPRTPDGRIMFAIPWCGRVLLGTTDVATDADDTDPRPFESEIDDILDVVARYLRPAPTRADILSSFAGLRPLAAPAKGAASAQVSREHAFDISPGGLLTVSGGKWTTYRLIAEQAVDLVARSAGLPGVRSSSSRTMKLAPVAASADPAYRAYGSEASAIMALVTDNPELGTPLHAALPYTGAHFAWAVRGEMAMHVADALAYNTRALYIDAGAARAIAPQAARIMARELGEDERWVRTQTRAAQAYAERFIPTRARDRPDSH